MKRKIDIIDVLLAVQRGELRVFEHRGYYLLEDVESGECVRLNAVPEMGVS